MPINPSFRRKVAIALLLVAIAMNLLSILFFLRIDSIVHNDLYRYGLQFNLEWAQTYWNTSWSTLVLVGLSSMMSFISSILLAYFDNEKNNSITSSKSFQSRISVVLIMAGVAITSLSIILNSSIITMVGLGLLFWGAILMYIRTEEYVKKTLLDATTLPMEETLIQIITKLGYRGPAVYLPPKYFSNPETQMIYVAKQKDALPSPDQLQVQKISSFMSTSDGILLIPPGAELAKLFEKTLETDFNTVNLEYLRERLPQLLIENLEIAKAVDLQVENTEIHVRLGESTYKVSASEAGQMILLGSPISSAIACVLAKATGKLVTVKSQRTSENGRDVTLDYILIE